MSLLPEAGAILIITLFIVSEVSSSTREEIIQQDPKKETFKETREAEVLESHSKGNEKFVGSREDDVSQRQARYANKTSQHVADNDAKLSNETSTVVKPTETSEMKSMVESFDPVEIKNNSTNLIETLTIATPRDNGEPAVTTEAVQRNSTFYNVNEESSNATVDQSNTTESSVEGKKISSTTVGSAVSTTILSIIAVTTSSPRASSTIEQPVSSVVTSTTTPPEPAVTTESSTKQEMINRNKLIVPSTPSMAELRLHSRKVLPKSPGMQSEIVALITAIAFAIVAVVAYVGIVFWRRYFRWRYGHRERLVNDFDVNDFSNFEL